MSPGGKASRAKGDRLEYAVIRDLKDRGYWTRRAPASKFPDIVAIEPMMKESRGPCRVVFIECKTNGRLDPAEWNELWDLAEAFDVEPVLASRGDRRPIVYRRLIAPKVEGERVTDAFLLDEWSP